MQINTTYNMDALAAARLLPDGCVDCIVTSPPYYGLRDYGVDGQIGLEETPCFTLIARMDKISPYIVTTEREGQQVAPFIRREGDTLIYEVYTTDSPIVVQIKEFMALYGLVDVKMRMLKIPELKRIMGFPANYKLVGTQAEQKKFIGNAVEVTMARVICEALGRMILDFENAA